MTYETRLTLNYTFGALTEAASTSQTTLISTDFAPLPPGLSTTSYVPITLQDASSKVHEIVWANSHSAGGTTLTAVRGKEATSARSWPAGTLWTVTPTVRDGVLAVANRAALPADPHVGLRCYLQDEQVIVEWVLGVGWVGTAASGYRASQLLTADAANVNLTGIPGSLKKVEVSWTARSTHGVVYDTLLLRMNGQAGGNFATIHTQVGANAYWAVDWAVAWATVGYVAGNLPAAWNWGSGLITFPAWNAPGRASVNYVAQGHFIQDQTTGNVRWHMGGQFSNTPPYTSLLFCPANGLFKAGTEFVVYGWY